MMRWALLHVVLMAALSLVWPDVARAQIGLGFPSNDAIADGFELFAPTPLGNGGGILHHVAGDELTETFLDTSVFGVNSSRWIFSMSEFTKLNLVSTFDAQINGTTVGTFQFTGADSQATHQFDLSFNHGVIAGDDYTLRIVATSTVPPGEGSWNWITGGIVSLSGGTVGVGSPTVVDTGTFQINAGNLGSIVPGKPFQLGSSVTLASNVALLVNVNTNQTFNNGIVVSTEGTGTVTIGTNSPSSATNAVIFSAPLVLNRPTTLQAQNTGAGRTTYTSTISGNVGTLTIAGGGRTTWQGINTFVGDIVVKDAGTVLQVGGPLTAPGDRIPNSASVDLELGTFLRLQNFSETINALSGGGTVENIVGSNTLTVGAAGGSGTFSGVLADGDPARVLSLTKIGAGTQVLSGANTYTGATTVVGGALRVEHAEALGAASSGTVVADGGRLELAGGITISGEALSLSGTGGGLGALHSISGTNAWNGVVHLDTADASFGAAAGQTLVVQGVVQDSGATAVNIASGNAGIVKLEAENTYTGGTSIAAGTLSIQAANNLGNPTGPTLVDFTGHGTLQITESFAIGKQLAAIGADRSITLEVAGGKALTANSQMRSTSGAGIVTKIGAGTLVLAANNSQLDSGIALAQGTLDVRHAGALGDAATDFVKASGGTTTRLAFDASTAVTASFETASSGANLVVDRVSPGAGVAHSLSNLVLSGAHTLNISAGGNIAGGNAGLVFSGDTTLTGHATITVDDGAAAPMQLSLASVTGAGQNLTIGGTGDTVITGAIATSAGTLTKQGSGSLTLSGANTYTGTTFVNAGTLMVNAITSGQGDYEIASGARLGGNGTIGLAAGRSVKISPFPGELSPGAAGLAYLPPAAPGGYTGHALDATYSAGLDPLTVDTLKIDGDVILGGYLLIDLLSPAEHDVLEVSGILSIGSGARLEINGQTELNQLDFLGALGMSEGAPLELVSAGSIEGSFVNAALNESFVDAAGRTIFLGSDNGRLYLLATSQALAVPEPRGLAAWMIMCNALLLWRRKGRRRRHALAPAARSLTSICGTAKMVANRPSSLHMARRTL